MKTKVAIAVSGGIDSLVAGFLIKQRFKKVFGVHFTTGYEKDVPDVSALASVFGFPVHTIDLSREFEARVVNYFVSTYMAGRTPNPCLVCNVQIKFKALFDHAQKLGADLMATGHYATVVNRYTPGRKKIAQAWLERATDRVFTDRHSKHKALIDKIREMHARRRPVLVGTSSVRESGSAWSAMARFSSMWASSFMPERTTVTSG